MQNNRWIHRLTLSLVLVLGLLSFGCATDSTADGALEEPTTVAQEQPVSDEAQGETLEWKLAVLQYGSATPKSGAEVERFRTLLTSIDSKTRNSRQECADMSVKAWQLVNEDGVADDLLYTMEQLDLALVEGDIQWNLAEIAAAYITLRTSQ